VEAEMMNALRRRKNNHLPFISHVSHSWNLFYPLEPEVLSTLVRRGIGFQRQLLKAEGLTGTLLNQTALFPAPTTLI
jgi:hypothetical protein